MLRTPPTLLAALVLLGASSGAQKAPGTIAPRRAEDKLAAGIIRTLGARIRMHLHNLANVDTWGYKRLRNLYVEPKSKALRYRRDWRQGVLEGTDRPLDLGIEGSAFLAFLTPDNTPAYSRDGSLLLDAECHLVNRQGYRLHPTLALPIDTIDVLITRKGEVIVTTSGQPHRPVTCGRIRLFTVTNPDGLVPLEGTGLYRATAAAGGIQPLKPGDSRGMIIQRFLERSNVVTTVELLRIQETRRRRQLLAGALLTGETGPTGKPRGAKGKGAPPRTMEATCSLPNPEMARVEGLFRAVECRINLHRRNLAHLGTAGYKAWRFRQQDSGKLPPGRWHSGPERRHTQGPLVGTNRHLDLAIRGQGFFAVRGFDGDLLYTRCGSLQVDPKGYLTAAGHRLIPDIILPEDTLELTITTAGLVVITTAAAPEHPVGAGQIQLTRFTNPAGLDPVGAILFRNTPATGHTFMGNPGRLGVGTLVQNHLELANVTGEGEKDRLAEAIRQRNRLEKLFLYGRTPRAGQAE